MIHVNTPQIQVWTVLNLTFDLIHSKSWTFCFTVSTLHFRCNTTKLMYATAVADTKKGRKNIPLIEFVSCRTIIIHFIAVSLFWVERIYLGFFNMFKALFFSFIWCFYRVFFLNLRIHGYLRFYTYQNGKNLIG